MASGVYAAKITSKGQVTLPARMREELALNTGDRIVFVSGDDGKYWIEARTTRLSDLRGIVKDIPGRLTSDKVRSLIEQSRSRWQSSRKRHGKGPL